MRIYSISILVWNFLLILMQLIHHKSLEKQIHLKELNIKNSVFKVLKFFFSLLIQQYKFIIV